MGRQALIACVAVPLIMFAAGQATADPETDALRQQLQQTVLQLRELQDQQAAGAAAAPAAPAPDADGQAKLAAARQALSAARGNVAALKASLSKAQADEAALTSTVSADAAELDKYKDALNQAADDNRALTNDRDHLKAELATTTNIATACQAKNDRLTAFAEDLLGAYRKVGFGDVLLDHEPVFGLRRVQLENIVQDREDAIRADHCDARLDAAPVKTTPPPAG